jgi:glycosyltransferase involved in cell wall biosynthesis
MTPRVSVVTSTFNRSERLRKAIESVLNQTYPDWEMVIVDDCSTDNTEEVVKSYRDERIRYFKLDKNFGNDTHPKNRGILEARGEYIAFLDDDNDYRPDHLAALVRELDRNPDIDIVYGDRWVIDEDKNVKDRLGQCLDFTPSLLLKKNYIDTSDVMARKSALQDVGGFDERYRKYVDWNLWLRLEKYGKKFKRVPLVLTNYHLHSQMKSVTVPDRNADGSPSVPLGSAPVKRPEWDPHDTLIELPYLGEVTPPNIAVFSITYGRLDYTKKAFESLHKTAGYQFDHYVVDNGSTDGTQEYLLELKKLGKVKDIILNPDNRGISIASNQALDLMGARFGRYRIIVKFDNDCICLSDDWLKKMVEIWSANHRLAMSPFVQGLKDSPGGAPRLAYGTICGELMGMTKHLGGICHFVDASGYKGFTWPEDEQLHGMQDLEFSQHLLFQGFQMGYLENYYVSHGPLGTEAQYQDYPEYFERRKQEKVTRYEEVRQP